MYIYELEALATVANEKFAAGERHGIVLFMLKDVPPTEFPEVVLGDLSRLGWRDITLTRKLQSEDDPQSLSFRDDQQEAAFKRAVTAGRAWLIYEKPIA